MLKLTELSENCNHSFWHKTSVYANIGTGNPFFSNIALIAKPKFGIIQYFYVHEWVEYPWTLGTQLSLCFEWHWHQVNRALYSRVGRFWVLRNFSLFVVPQGAKWRNKILKNYFDPKNNESYPFNGPIFKFTKIPRCKKYLKKNSFCTT